jgi:hypothetical protein
VETNEKIERLLLAVHSAFNSLMERKRDFDAAAVRDMFQGNAGMQMTLLKLLDRHNGEMKARVGVDRVNPEKPDVPINKNDAFQKVQKRRVQEKR